MTIVHYGDFDAMNALGSEYLRKCKVSTWKFVAGRWLPLGWLVPDDVINDLDLKVMNNAQAYCNRDKPRKRSVRNRKPSPV